MKNTINDAWDCDSDSDSGEGGRVVRCEDFESAQPASRRSTQPGGWQAFQARKRKALQDSSPKEDEAKEDGWQNVPARRRRNAQSNNVAPRPNNRQPRGQAQSNVPRPNNSRPMGNTGNRGANRAPEANQQQRRSNTIPRNIATLGELKVYVRQCYRRNQFPQQHDHKIFRSLRYYGLTVPRGTRESFDQLWRELARKLRGPSRPAKDNDAMSTTSTATTHTLRSAPSPSDSVSVVSQSDVASTAGSVREDVPKYPYRNTRRPAYRNSQRPATTCNRICFLWLRNYVCNQQNCPYKHELPQKAIGHDGCPIPCRRFMSSNMTCEYEAYPMACRYSHTAGFCKTVKQDTMSKRVYLPPS